MINPFVYEDCMSNVANYTVVDGCIKGLDYTATQTTIFNIAFGLGLLLIIIIWIHFSLKQIKGEK